MDKSFINKVKITILDHIEDEKFNVGDLASKMGFSQSQILRKLRASTGKSANQFIREIRLEEAAKLIRKNKYTASEIAYRVGFGSPSYFNKCFHDHFGVTPGEFKDQKKEVFQENNDRLDSDKGNYFSKRKTVYLILIFVSAVLVTFFFVRKDSFRKNKLENSIAVLYFDDMSAASDTQWFCDGITDEIYTNLSKLKDLKVISRTSAKRFKNSDKTTPEITKALGVSYVVEGSVKKYSDMFRITVKLLNSYDETVWSQEYDKKTEQILEFQREVSKNIAEQLHIIISPEEEKILNKAPTDNLKAYENYLKGRFYWGLRTKKDLERSIYYYDQALELDSTYALAYAGLADSYIAMAWWRWYPKNEGYKKGKEFATKALSINNKISEAHSTLGTIALHRDWKWENAERELKLAISLNPNNAIAHLYYSELLNLMGKIKESMVEINIALSLNPHSLIIPNVGAWFYFNIGDFEKALLENQKVRDLNIYFEGNIWLDFYIYVFQKRDLKAIEELEELVQLHSLTEKYSFNITKVYNDFGMEGIFRELIQSELEMPDANTPTRLAKYYAFIGEDEKALNYLEIMFETRNRSTIVMNNTIFYKDLQSEPRFQAILKKMGLED